MSNKPNKVVEILMKRDGMTRLDAEELFKEVRATVLSCLDEGDTEGAEDALECDLGLEPDFLDYFLW